MKWFVIVLFSMNQGAFVFTDPVHDSEDICVGSISDPEMVPIYVYRILQEYQRPMPIEGIACANEEQLKTFLLMLEGGQET